MITPGVSHQMLHKVVGMPRPAKLTHFVGIPFILRLSEYNTISNVQRVSWAVMGAL